MHLISLFSIFFVAGGFTAAVRSSGLATFGGSWPAVDRLATTLLGDVESFEGASYKLIGVWIIGLLVFLGLVGAIILIVQAFRRNPPLEDSFADKEETNRRLEAIEEDLKKGQERRDQMHKENRDFVTDEIRRVHDRIEGTAAETRKDFDQKLDAMRHEVHAMPERVVQLLHSTGAIGKGERK